MEPASLNNGRILVSWNPMNKHQVDEAKTQYIQARKENRAIFDSMGIKITQFSSALGVFEIGEVELNEDEIAVRLVNETGDERLIWNVKKPEQVKEAAKRFQKYIDKGWRAYSIKADGKKGPRIFGFDPDSEEVVLDENTIKMRLDQFVKNFRKIEIVPKTFPG